jgi:hypothetical protein
MATGAVSSGVTEAYIQTASGQGLNPNGIAAEAGKGSLISGLGAIAGVGAYAAGLTTEAATVTAATAEIVIDATNVVQSTPTTQPDKKK